MPIQSFKKQQGATLIESLVSLVILAIAVIGMLGVQVRTLMDTNTAAGRTQAMLLIEDLSERVKANPAGYSALPEYEMLGTDTITVTTNCATAACDSAALATYDKDQWLRNFRATLPSGRVQTFVSADNPRQLGVLIGWTMRDSGDAADNYSASFAVDNDQLNTGLIDVNAQGCWDGLICHLAYIEP